MPRGAGIAMIHLISGNVLKSVDPKCTKLLKPFPSPLPGTLPGIIFKPSLQSAPPDGKR
jgi:hypothetical protein